MYYTMDNAGPDGAIFLILLAVVILQTEVKVVRCAQFYLFLKTERHLQQNTPSDH